MYNVGEFVAIAMNVSINTIRAGRLFLTFLGCAAFVALGQESPAQSLGDVARKTRQERSAPTHVPARRVAAEDFDGPDASGVWRMRLCTISPCYELSVTLPKNPKWIRASTGAQAGLDPGGRPRGRPKSRDPGLCGGVE